MSSRDGKLIFDDEDTQQKMSGFLATTNALLSNQLNINNPEAVVNFKVPRHSNHAAMQIMLSSIALSTWSIETSPSDRMVVAYLYDPQKPLLPNTKQLMDIYELTKAQANVAVHLCSSDNIIGASEALDISINTARSHLRDIYIKTGTKSQLELAKLLTSTLKTYDSNRPGQ
jgi:DNA-binding CsgD family transcriptional regulator